MEQAKRRPGRPPVERRRIPMAMRITPELRDQLVASAEAKGRSVTQQLEWLLAQGLVFEDMFGGDMRRSNLAMTATFNHAGKAAALGRLTDQTPAAWLANSECYRIALGQMIMAMLQARRKVYRLRACWRSSNGLRAA